MSADALPRGAVTRLGGSNYRLPGRYATVFLMPPDYRSYVAADVAARVYREYDLETGEPTRVLIGPDVFGQEAGPSADGSVVWVHDHRRYRVVAAADGRVLLDLLSEPELCGIAVSPDGRRAAAQVRDQEFVQLECDADMEGVHTGAVGVHDVAGIAPPVEFRPLVNYGVNCTFSPDGRLIAVTGEWHSLEDDRPAPFDGPPPVQVFDATTGTEVVRIRPPEDDHVAAAFLPDGRHLLLGSNWGTVPLGVWDVTTGQQVTMYRIDRSADGWTHVRCVPAPDGRELIGLRSSVGEVVRRDVRTGAVLGTTPSPFGQQDHLSPRGLAVRADGTVVVLQVENQTVYAWTAPDAQPLTRPSGGAAPITTLAFSEDGSEVRTLGREPVARRWDARTGELLAAVRLPEAVASHLGRFFVRPTGLLVAWSGGPVATYDLVTGAVRIPPPAARDSSQCVSVSADGWLVDLSVHSSGEGETRVCLWNVLAGTDRVVHRFECHSAAAAYDRGRVLLAYNDRANARRTLTCFLLTDAGATPLWARTVPVGAEFRDPHTLGPDHAKVAFDRGIPSVLWAPDGATALVVPAPERVPLLIDAANGATLGEWDEPTSGPFAVHPTRPVVACATVEGDGLILTDWRTGARLAVVMEMCFPHAVAWSPDGTLLAASGPDGTAWVFAADQL